MASADAVAAVRKPASLLEVLRHSAKYLARARVPAPRLEAELLLAKRLGLGRLDLYLQFERLLTESELEPLRQQLRERARGRPLAQLLGEKEFFGMAFSVSGAVLIPRPETELLVERAIALSQAAPAHVRVAELGTGSGCVAIALAARVPQTRITAWELSPEAVAAARANVGRHSLESQVEVLEGDWSQDLGQSGSFSLIVSNPPYVTTGDWRQLEPSVRDYEPRLALDGGEDGLGAYRTLVPAAARLAAPGARVLLECDPMRIESVSRLCLATWPGARTSSHPDLSGRPRVLELELA
ncbi:MAG: peptide chain release factor N(5)-glutamine methyltransferase [Candidatus Dormibacteria bacterium]